MKEQMLNNLNSERMNIIQKLDDWYKEWMGVPHLEESNLQVLDSSDAQDFARYCIDEYKSLVSGAEQNDINCNMPIVSNCSDTEAPYFDKNGKQIKEFAVLKVYHFLGVNEQGMGRKHYYMYKWVRLKEHKGKKYWIAMHLNSDKESNYYNLRAVADKQTRIISDAEIVQQY